MAVGWYVTFVVALLIGLAIGARSWQPVLIALLILAAIAITAVIIRTDHTPQ